MCTHHQWVYSLSDSFKILVVLSMLIVAFTSTISLAASPVTENRALSETTFSEGGIYKATT